MTERVDSVGDLEEGGSSSVRSSVETLSEDSEEEETDPRVKEVGSKKDGIFSSIKICDYMVTNIHVGLSVCGILFCLQIFRYTNSLNLKVL